MAQLVRAPPCHGGGRGFESHSGRLQETLSVDCLIKLSWDHSSAGRASALQAEGHRFEPYWSHFARKFFKVENIEREMWRVLRAMHTALKSWHKNISYGGIAQLARARGSYPRCRWFKSSSRYYKKESLCGASFCVISILSFMKTLNIICHIPTFILKL